MDLRGAVCECKCVIFYDMTEWECGEESQDPKDSAATKCGGRIFGEKLY